MLSGAFQDLALQDSVYEIRKRLAAGDKGITPFHWDLEFPEVFEGDDGGFNVFVGNPPFVGVTSLADTTKEGYTDFLRNKFSGTGGKCDLAAFFVRTAFQAIKNGGVMGMIVTNTIAQGDTRRSSLTHICRQDGEIYCAKKNLKWPGMAAVMISIVHIQKRGLHPVQHKSINGIPAQRISSFLLDNKFDEDPFPLQESCALGFLGAKIQGIGFTISESNPKCPSPNEISEALAQEPTGRAYIKPFLGGDDINKSSLNMAARQVIDLNAVSPDSNRDCSKLFDIVKKYVYPERKNKNGSLSREWWKYGHQAKDMRAAISGLGRAIATARISQNLGFAFIDTDQVINDKVVVFASDSYALFSILSSSVHEIWMRITSSTLEDRLNYSINDGLTTFPFPPKASIDRIDVLAHLGMEFERKRAAYLVDENIGLTEFYNRLYSPAVTESIVIELRGLQEAIDDSCYELYGWSDLTGKREYSISIGDIHEPEDGFSKEALSFIETYCTSYGNIVEAASCDSTLRQLIGGRRKVPWAWLPGAIESAAILTRLMELNDVLNQSPRPRTNSIISLFVSNPSYDGLPADSQLGFFEGK